MRLSPICPQGTDFKNMLGFNWNNVGGYANVWQIGPLRVIASPNQDGWEHVSVSLEHRCPSWTEMEFVKRSFWLPTETAMQLHVPEQDHVNFHPYCLHLWAPVNGMMIPRPPNHLVGAPG